MKTSRAFRFICLILLVLLSACGARRVIVNNLDEKEANEIIVYLATKGVDATKVPAPVAEGGGGGGKAALWNISVDEVQGNEAMALLNQVGLPRRKGQNLLGIFGNTSLVPSGLQEKIRYQAGLAEQIASTIRKIDGVLDADVQISFPDEDPLNPNANKQRITASVYVKHNGVLDDPNAHLQTRIKRLVAGSINGLDYDNVTVIGDKARYGDSGSSTTNSTVGEEEKKLIHIWGVVLAHDSATRFQVLFFGLLFFLLLIGLSLLWTLWKVFPLLQATGGWRPFFLSYHPFHLKDLQDASVHPEAKEPSSPDEVSTSSSVANKEPAIEQGVDET